MKMPNKELAQIFVMARLNTTAEPDANTPVAALYDMYKEWLADCGVRPNTRIRKHLYEAFCEIAARNHNLNAATLTQRVGKVDCFVGVKFELKK